MDIKHGITIDYPDDYRQTFAKASEAGFDFVELNMESRFSRGTVAPAGINEVVTEHDLTVAVHLPAGFDIASPHEHARDGACRELEANIDTAVELGAETAVFHASSFASPHDWDEKTVFDALYRSCNRLETYASERGITVCAENLKGPFVDVTSFPDLFAQSNTKMCLDTGHAFVTGMDGIDQAQFLREHSDRIAHVHLNDTRIRENDEHLPVGLGQIDFLPLAEAMIEENWTGTCTHEIFGFDDEFEYARVGKRRFESMLNTGK